MPRIEPPRSWIGFTEGIVSSCTWSISPRTSHLKPSRMPMTSVPWFTAWMVTEPAMLPVTVSEAMPEDAVPVPSPVTDPAPADWVKTTTVELSEVTVLPPASCTATVSVFVEPDATELVPEVKASWAAVPTVTLKLLLSVVVRAPSVAWRV